MGDRWSGAELDRLRQAIEAAGLAQDGALDMVA